MLHLLLGKDWTANREVVLDRIAHKVKLRYSGQILIVPELISHETERRLCVAAGATSSRYAEVLTFTRLTKRVSEAMQCAPEECLDSGGRVIAMAASARQLRSKLKAYAAVETKPEFLSGLVEGMDEFKRCCISSQDLVYASSQTEGSLAQKLEELALLMEGYDAICARGKRDPRDQITWLLELLEDSDFASEHSFFVDGFPDFTRQHMAILEHLIQKSPHVTISLNCDSMDSRLLAFEKAGKTASELYRTAQRSGVPVSVEFVPEKPSVFLPMREKLFQGNIQQGVIKDRLKVYHVENIWQECKHAAEEICRLVRTGCRYRDITVVCADMRAYKSVIELVFHRMHIPLYQSGTEDILQKSVLATVLSALDAALSGFDQKDMLRYFRSALSPLTLDEYDRIENYAILWGIRGNRWSESWTYHPDGLGAQWDDFSRNNLTELETLRNIGVSPLLELKKGFQQAVSIRQQVEALYTFLDSIGFENKLIEWAETYDSMGENREAQILNQLWEILISALEQMYDVLGDTHWESQHFVRLLRLLLSQYDVGTIPPVLDAVQMGLVSAMRCHEEKHLIVLGAQEGNLPGYPGATGVLTDQERVALRQMGVPLTGGAMEGIQAEFAEIYGVFCGATESVHVYCSGTQPSFVFRRLSQLSGGTLLPTVESGYAAADSVEAGAWLAKWNAEELARSLELLEEYKDAVHKISFSMGRVKRNHIQKLYGNTLNLSASQIDRQAECRMSYFLKYGLRVQERKEAAVDPAEFGTYVHAVLENTARCIRDMGGFHNVSLEETLDIAHRFSEEYASERFKDLSSERLTYLFRRNVQELDMVVRELWSELKESLFEPKDFEVNFGGTDGLPPIPIPNKEINAILRGYVDRVDTWMQDGNCYYRVVDYKTGKKDFDYCDVFNGVGLQMLLYLFALKHSGEDLLGAHPVPSGVQYFPARAPYLTSDGRLNEEEAEISRLSQWKRRGILLLDEAVLQAMEPGDNPKRLSCAVRKDGSISGDVADRDQLRALEDYVFRVIANLVEDIASGNIEPNPYTRGTSHDACAFCPYGAICRKATVKDRRNYKAMKADRFWEEIEKELNRHGR